MPTSYWLLKTEPGTYAFSQLIQDGKTNWNGVRNFQARNFLKQAQPGDLALIYHSGEERAVVGISEVIRGAYPDPDPKKPGDWVQIDLKPVRALREPVTLSQIKTHPKLLELPLIKQSRLSVMPISKAHFETLSELGS